MLHKAKIRILLTFVGALIFIVLISRINLTQLTSIVFEKITWKYWTMLSLITIIQLIFRTFRFKLLLKRLFQKKISLCNSFLLTSASLFVSLITPLRSGEALRGLFMTNLRFETTAVSLYEYATDTLIVILIPVFGVIYVFDSYASEIAFFYIMAISVMVVTFIFFKYFNREKYLNGLKRFKIYNENAFRLKKFFIEGVQNKLALFIGLIFGCLFYGIYFWIFYAVLLKLGAQITLLETIVSASLGVFIGALTFIPSGIGSRDISIYSVLTVFGIDSQIAITALFIVRSISLVIIIIGGICYFILINRFHKVQSKLNLVYKAKT